MASQRYVLNLPQRDRYELLEVDDEDPRIHQRREVSGAQLSEYAKSRPLVTLGREDYDNHLRRITQAQAAGRPTTRVIRKHPEPGPAYEALEYQNDDPSRATQTLVTPGNLRRWEAEGGFDEVSDRDWRQHLNRTRGVEEAESHLRVAPDIDLEEEIPGVRQNIAPALDMRATESTSYERPARDEEYARAVAEGDTQRQYRGIQRAGAGLLETFTSVKADPSRFEEDPEANPVKRLLAQREMDRKARLSDPSSPESKRLQQAVASAMPGAYTPQQLATIAAEDADYVTDFVRVRSAAEGRAAAAKEAARRAAEQREYDEEKARLDREATIRAAGITAAGRRSEAEADRALKKEIAEMEAGTQTRRAEGDLRKELQGNKVYKDYEDAQVAFDKVRAAAADPNAQSDIALIYAVMKVFDPGSVVKETEFATAANAGGVPERIRNYFNRAHSGERISQQQRDEFVKVAEGQLGAYRKAYERLAEGYKGLATGSGIDPNRVVLPRQPSTAPAQAAPLPPPAILPNGKRAARTRMPDGSIWEEQADGSAKRVK